MAKVPLQDQINCVKREITMREKCYPKWVENAPNKKGQYDRELSQMKAVLATLEWLQTNESTIKEAVRPKE